MFVKSDLVDKFNWPEMSPREVEFLPGDADTSTSNVEKNVTTNLTSSWSITFTACD